MKKVLLIVPSLHQGGLERVCAVTAKLLAPYYDVQIALFDSQNAAYDVKGIRVNDLKLPSRSGKAGKVLNVLKRGWKIRRLKRKEKIDIAYSFGPTANLANIFSGKRGQRWLGIRSYMDMGNPRQIRFFCRHSDRMICCSETIHQEIEASYHCRHACTLRNPIDTAQIRAQAEAEQAQLPWNEGRIIVSMGREDEVKGYWHLLKIFSEVHKRLPDTRLMIIGKGEFEDYRKLAFDLNVDDAVYFTGLKKNPYPYLKKSALYVLTSYYEGFPNALVEAMSLGLPAVATDCMTGPGEILEDKYGILVPNMDADCDLNAAHITEEEKSVAARIVSLLENEEEMAHYRELSEERAAMYSAEDYVEQIRSWAD